MRRTTVKVDADTVRAILNASGKHYGQIGEEIGYSESYISYVLKSGLISVAALKAIQAVCGIDLGAAVRTVASAETVEPVEEPETTTTTVRIELTPETVSILENYSYERTTDIARLITAINRLADAWK